jgi:histone H3/H4
MAQSNPKAMKRMMRDLLLSYEKKYKMEKFIIYFMSDACETLLMDIVTNATKCMKHAKRNKLMVSDVLLALEMK